MPLERPTNLISAADMQVLEALKELAKPKHCEFSRFFPRIRGTPPKYKGKRARAKRSVLAGVSVPSQFEDIKKGLMNFIEWADKVTTHMVKAGAEDSSENPWKLQEPSSANLKAQMHFLFNKWCDMTNVRGSEKRSMRIQLDFELIKLKKEFVDFEKSKAEELVS